MKGLDIASLQRFRTTLAQVIRVPEHAFGDLETEYIRFDFDGSGRLGLNEVYKLVKFHLREYRKKVLPAHVCACACACV